MVKFIYQKKQELLTIGGIRMNAKELIGKQVMLKVNRKLGSKHPDCNLIYPMNYGYIPARVSGATKKLDAYILGIFEPLEVFEGTCIAVLHHFNNTDDKLVVVPDGKNYTDAQINALTEFQEKFFEHTIIR